MNMDIKPLGVLALLVVLNGCGGSGSSSEEQVNVPPEVTADAYGQLLDSPVAGIRVVSGQFEGITSEDGTFGYKNGEQVQFFVGDIAVGEQVEPKSVLTPADLANNDAYSALNIARFLQTLDDDADPENGIQITTLTHQSAASRVLDFSSPDWESAGNGDSPVDEMMYALTAQSSAGARYTVAAEEAYLHFSSTLDGFISELDVEIDATLNTSGCTEDSQCKEYSLTSADVVFCSALDDKRVLSGTTTNLEQLDMLAQERDSVIDTKADIYHAAVNEDTSGACFQFAPQQYPSCNNEGVCELAAATPDAYGQLVDSPVAGLRAVSGRYEGMTDESGMFGYKLGETVQFFVGDIAIGYAVAPEAVITPLELANNDAFEALNIARFLQSLDNDADPENGIQIADSSHAFAANQSLDFASSDWHSATQADSVIGKLLSHLTQQTQAGPRVAISPSAAYQHFAITLDDIIDVFESEINDTLNVTGCSGNSQCHIYHQNSSEVSACPPLPAQRVYSDTATDADLLARLDSERLTVINAKGELYYNADIGYAGDNCEATEQPTVAICVNNGCELRENKPDAYGQFNISGGVSGIRVVSGYYEGFTDENGNFGYLQGEQVQFFIGDIALGGPVDAQANITPVDLAGQEPLIAINISRFLQSLDDDGLLDNGIEIAASSHELARGENLDFLASEWRDAELESSSIGQLLYLLTSQTAAGSRYSVSAHDAYVQLASELDVTIDALAADIGYTLEDSPCSETSQCKVYGLATSLVTSCPPLPQRFAYSEPATDVPALDSLTAQRNDAISLKSQLYTSSLTGQSSGTCFTFAQPLYPVCNDSGYCELKEPEPDGYGQLLDSSVEGIRVVSGNYQGYTDENGRFGYKLGERVQFFIGDIAVGYQIEPKAILTPLDLAENDSFTALNIARFLQSLDNDAEADNGIQIAESSHTLAAGKSLDFLASEWHDAEEESSAIGQLVYELTSETTAGSRLVIPDDTAYWHFAETLDGFIDELEGQIKEAIDVSGCSSNNQCNIYSLPSSYVGNCPYLPTRLVYAEPSTSIEQLQSLDETRNGVISAKYDLYYEAQVREPSGSCFIFEPLLFPVCNSGGNCELQDTIPLTPSGD